MTAAADRFYMGLALELARRGEGATSPNPLVGCVVVRDGRVVGRGYHARAGGPHAEVLALAEAGDAARGADLYVTLEPCAHHGRTPPCVGRVIAAGVGRVVIAMGDPNPRVAGRGERQLRRAGIRVTTGVREEEARRLNEAFCLSITAGRAFVHLKLAATLDGRLATRTGDSRWVTGAASRERVHRLRARCGAVLVGAGTARADDPRLTVRLPGQPERPVLRAVLSSRLDLPDTLRLVADGEASRTVLFHGPGAPGDRRRRFAARGVRLVEVPRLGDGLDLQRVLTALYDLGRMEVLVEGGAVTAQRFLDQGLVDRFHLFLAPRLLGGGIPVLAGPGPERMDEAVGVDDLAVERVGRDLYLTGRPATAGWRR